MIISGHNLGKKFERNWIFRNLNIELDGQDSLAIVGPNGSGKSTLLQLLTSTLTPSEGTLEYFDHGKKLDAESVIQRINFSAPYVELIEEFSLREHLQFHTQFRPREIPVEEMLIRIGYEDAWDRTVGQFSSGMKQRLRLALAFFFDSDIIALDEPTANLDQSGIDWYLTEIRELLPKKSILISSNQRYEYDFCKKTIQLDLH